MNMCQDHWDRLRAKIEERGLSDLVSTSSETALAQVADQFRKGEEDSEVVTPTNFDPLMSAFWAIGSNIMTILGENSLYLLSSGPEDRVTGYGLQYENKTWPRCGLCYLGLAHEMTCRDKRCSLPKVDGYAWMLDQAADDSREKAFELNLLPSEDKGE